MINLIGRVFGKLTVLELGETKCDSSNRKRRHWKVQCQCGSPSFDIRQDRLTRGQTKSCLTCYPLVKKEQSTKHGDAVSSSEYNSLYNVWRGLRSRVSNPNDKKSHIYYGKGFQEEWKDYTIFKEDMIKKGYIPNNKLTLDRIKSDLGYFRKNVKLSTYAEQNRNTSRNIKVIIPGVGEKILLDAITFFQEKFPNYKIRHYNSVRYRIEHGWPIIDAILIPEFQKRKWYKTIEEAAQDLNI